MRYAIYHLPSGGLGEWGSAWLGWDARRGCEPGRPAIAGLPGDAGELVSTPMRYGFHATLKAPFRLAEGLSVADLAGRTAAICDGLAPFELPLGLHSDWGFVMLRPPDQPEALRALERALVTGLDPLRAPLTEAELARRKPHLLSAPARAHLDAWGYPFVLDLFNYHLTLSNSLPPAEARALQDALAPAVAPLIAAPMRVAAVALMAEDDNGRLHMLEELPLRGAS